MTRPEHTHITSNESEWDALEDGILPPYGAPRWPAHVQPEALPSSVTPAVGRVAIVAPSIPQPEAQPPSSELPASDVQM